MRSTWLPLLFLKALINPTNQEQLQPYKIAWTYPAYGSIIELESPDGAMITNDTVVVRFSVSPKWPQGATVLVDVAGQLSLELQDPIESVAMHKVEPGTVYVSAVVMDAVTREALGPVSSTVFEATLSSAEQRRHSYRPPHPSPYLAYGTPSKAAAAASVVKSRQMLGGHRRPIRLTFVGMLKMDGQKTIWLQQMRYFNELRARTFKEKHLNVNTGSDEEKEEEEGDEFELSFLTFDDGHGTTAINSRAGGSLVESTIRALGVPFTQRPMPALSFEDIREGLYFQRDDWWLRAEENYGLSASVKGTEAVRQGAKIEASESLLTMEEVDAKMPKDQAALNPVLLGGLAREGGIDVIVERGRRELAMLAGSAGERAVGKWKQKVLNAFDGIVPGAPREAQEAATQCPGLVGLLLPLVDTREANYAALMPPFTRKQWVHLTSSLAAERADLLVFANARDASDLLLVAAARLAGVPKLVMDLPNLFPLPGIDVDAFVAPSHFAATHESVVAAAAATGTPVHVISPGVNVSDFSPEAQDTISCHPGCETGSVSASDAPSSSTAPSGPFRCGCPVVGFLARISPEKSPGMFLRAAALVAEAVPEARFLVVGDGPLLDPMQAMAQHAKQPAEGQPFVFRDNESDFDVNHTAITRWTSLAEKFYFTGGIYSGLPSVLAGMDVLVNPSLRAWSETFCIVNIEAMAMKTAVISFGVGGVQEYLVDEDGGPPHMTNTIPENPRNCSSHEEGAGGSSSTGHGACTQHQIPKSNGKIVSEATNPNALAKGIIQMLGDTTRRREIGARARDAALSRFTIEHMTGSYRELYRDLIAGAGTI